METSFCICSGKINVFWDYFKTGCAGFARFRTHTPAVWNAARTEKYGTDTHFMVCRYLFYLFHGVAGGAGGLYFCIGYRFPVAGLLFVVLFFFFIIFCVAQLQLRLCKWSGIGEYLFRLCVQRVHFRGRDGLPHVRLFAGPPRCRDFSYDTGVPVLRRILFSFLQY